MRKVGPAVATDRRRRGRRVGERVDGYRTLNGRKNYTYDGADNSDICREQAA